MKMPLTSVRGRVRAFIEQHADGLGDDVLEIGSNIGYAAATFRSNRDLARARWLGIDMQDGPGVDLVCDVMRMPPHWLRAFSGVLCSEVLEHLRDPRSALGEIHAVMRPGALLILTTLFAFPEHAFPNDYFRYTCNGLRALLEDAGFQRITCCYSGTTPMDLNDHGEPETHHFDVPIHSMAIAYA